ncbi:hypothetical protein CsatB_007333 [Cannabis sativa]|uniref:L10-interacting MYB domain-containing protein-like n=1 Tax=Cannabis sativa TaxID=3483 RepID=UPI0029CAA726|nr:L10-interacting MYB domain-containing protein-like [Cannabis sativa]
MSMTTENIDDDTCLWGPTIEKIFIDIMVDEVNKGNMTSGQFSSKTSARILEDLQSKSKRKYVMKQVKQKFHRLRIRYREFSELSKQTGFGWSREKDTVIAPEEVWQNYIRAHPRAAQYQKKGCDHFRLLELIFSKSTATGLHHRSAASGPPNTNDEREMENDLDHVDIQDIDDNDSASCICSRLVDDIFKRSAKNSATTSVERVKRQRSQQMSDAIVAWTEVAKVRAEATLAKAEKYKSKSEVGGSQKDEFSLTKCMQILEGIEGVDDDIYMKAVEKFKDSDWREIFINMSTARKRAWLDRL